MNKDKHVLDELSLGLSKGNVHLCLSAGRFDKEKGPTASGPGDCIRFSTHQFALSRSPACAIRLVEDVDIVLRTSAKEMRRRVGESLRQTG